MSREFRSLVLLAALGAVLGLTAPDDARAGDARDDVAVIVNRVNTSPDPTFAELKAVLTLDRQFWQDGKRVVLILPPMGSPVKDLMLAKVYHRTDAQLRNDWARRLFAGEIPAVPTSVRSVDALVAAVTRSPGAVAMVPAGTAMPETVRVLAIDGRRPGDPGYALAPNGS